MFAAVTEDASGTGLCKLCRVRFRLSIFGESAAEVILFVSLTTLSTAGSDDILAFRDCASVAVNNSLSTYSCTIKMLQLYRLRSPIKHNNAEINH